MRVGLGYDVHRLVPGRPLVLGGVEVPFDRGLLGHSDGDALCHAIMDALLGAAGLEDIGSHFPSTDPQYQGISSLILLQRVGEIIKAKKLRVVNIDATVLAEAPRLAPFMAGMKEKLGRALGLEPGQVGIKATTGEGLGFVGRGEGIAAVAVALLENEAI